MSLITTWTDININQIIHVEVYDKVKKKFKLKLKNISYSVDGDIITHTYRILGRPVWLKSRHTAPYIVHRILTLTQSTTAVDKRPFIGDTESYVDLIAPRSKSYKDLQLEVKRIREKLGLTARNIRLSAKRSVLILWLQKHTVCTDIDRCTSLVARSTHRCRRKKKVNCDQCWQHSRLIHNDTTVSDQPI